MASIACPVLMNISNEDQCLENFAGLGSIGYLFLKDDIDKSKLVATNNIYAWTDETFRESGHFYKLELKPESQSITGESNGKNKGFRQTANLVIEVVNEKTSELLRALNNLDWGFIIPDGDSGEYQIMYSSTRKIALDSGALKTETGAASGDDRITTLAPVLSPVKYPNTFVTFPEEKTPESYLAPAEPAERRRPMGEI